jgi:plasmid stabilization system protein ParE
MRVIWSDFATSNLYDIYKYYKETAGENVARELNPEYLLLPGT